MASGLPHRLRFYLVTNAVLAVMDVARPDAIYWRASQQFVDPEVFAEAAGSSDLHAFAAGGLNVRMFNIADSEGETLMDTMGLRPFGLPDFQ